MDESFAATGVVYEEIITMDLDHRDIFRQVPKNNMFIADPSPRENVSLCGVFQSTPAGNASMAPFSYFIFGRFLTAHLT